MTKLHPLVFEPVYKDYLWGGDRLASVFGRRNTPSPCAESWEISDRPDGMSVVALGPLKGTALGRLTREFPAEMFGPGSSFTSFPLLCKIIDARLRLSVQAHPNEATAAAFGGEPKTEAWYVLRAEPGAKVFAGLKPGVDESAVRRALADGSMESLLRAFPVGRGDVVFLPGGRVHAIGEGCLLYEIQQNSNTTYRLFDWNRMGPDGKPRELHVEQALKTALWNDTEEALAPRIDLAGAEVCGHGSALAVLLECPWFHIEQLAVSRTLAVEMARPGPEIVFVETGGATVESGGIAFDLEPGTTVLMPACLERYDIAPLRGHADLLRINIP